MTDRKEAELRGGVRTCQLELDYVYSDRHWVMQTADVYSREGNLLERRHRNPDGSQWSTICRYDEQERILEKACLGQTLTAEELFLYHYDELGRLERVMARSRDGSERVFESFRYANDGTKTQIAYPPPLDERNRMSAASDLHFSVDASGS
jgi:hypothetical protein